MARQPKKKSRANKSTTSTPTVEEDEGSERLLIPQISLEPSQEVLALAGHSSDKERGGTADTTISPTTKKEGSSSLPSPEIQMTPAVSDADAVSLTGERYGDRDDQTSGPLDLKIEVEPRRDFALQDNLSQDTQPADHPIYSRMRALRFVRINHSVVFLLYALGGTFALITLKWFLVDINILAYLCAAALIMGSYFVLNMRDWAGLKLRYDQLGDNLYYLGFIYTLGTLTHTLYSFEAAEKSIHEIIASFGVALTSTVLGVIFRIVAHLMRLDPHEVEDAVRSDLLDLTARVRGALDVVVRDMTVFGDQTRQAIAELHEDVSENITGNVSRLVSASNRVLQSVDSSFSAFATNTERVNNLTGETIRGLGVLIAKIEAIEAPANLIEQKLIPATTHIERLVLALTTSLNAEDVRGERLGAAIDAMNTAIAAVQKNISLISGAVNHQEIADRVKLAGDALRETSSYVLDLRDQMKELAQFETQSLTLLRGEYANSVSVMHQQNLLKKAELERFHSLTAQSQDALVELARALRKAI